MAMSDPFAATSELFGAPTMGGNVQDQLKATLAVQAKKKKQGQPMPNAMSYFAPGTQALFGNSSQALG
jgi:hypothetical protein